MKIKNSIWQKYYECDCHHEGIMLRHEIDEGFPQLELAFFSFGKVGENISLFERLRWCWYIIRRGFPYCDQIILRQETARELGKDLIKFANRKVKNEKKV